MNYVLYQSIANEQWYWRLVGANRKTVAIAGQGYLERADAIRGIQLVQRTAPTTAIFDLLGNLLPGL